VTSDKAVDLGQTHPEVDLLVELHGFIANPVAIDVGANVGDVSECLLRAGFEVYAFEPYAPAFERLIHRLGVQQTLHAFQIALGAADGEGLLNIACDYSPQGKWDTSLFHSLIAHPMLDDLRFVSSQLVKVRSLASLIVEGIVPAHAGVLKIDTEGLDLQVLQGMGVGRFDVVLAEFWDIDHPFGRAGHGRLSDLVRHMHQRKYHWHLVIYRVDEEQELSFLVNRDTPPSGSWGNAIFFQDHSVFVKAFAWCEIAFG
jgi:FkbM family methyltransferase